MIKAVIFDYFDVLVHDEYWHVVAEQADASGNASQITQLNKDVNSGAISWQEFCEIIAKQMNVTTEFVDKKYHELQFNKRLLLYANELKDRGYKVALLSNAASEYLRPILQSTGLEQLFDAVSISTEIGAIKPHPNAYASTIKLLNIAPNEAVMIDDAQHNVDGAIAAGLAGIRYQNFEQAKQELEAQLAG